MRSWVALTIWSTPPGSCTCLSNLNLKARTHLEEGPSCWIWQRRQLVALPPCSHRRVARQEGLLAGGGPPPIHPSTPPPRVCNQPPPSIRLPLEMGPAPLPHRCNLLLGDALFCRRCLSTRSATALRCPTPGRQRWHCPPAAQPSLALKPPSKQPCLPPPAAEAQPQQAAGTVPAATGQLQRRAGRLLLPGCCWAHPRPCASALCQPVAATASGWWRQQKWVQGRLRRSSSHHACYRWWRAWTPLGQRGTVLTSLTL